MLKKSFIILFFIVATKTFCVLGASSPDLCPALNHPNALLLDHFTKVSLKKSCTKGPLRVSPLSISRKAIGCFYSVPTSWATSINYPQLSKSGMILRSKDNPSCPTLSYKDFEIVTLKGAALVEDTLWKTLQVNQIKRILKKDSGVPPKNAPYFVSPETMLHIVVYKVHDTFIPLIDQTVSLKRP